MRMTHSTTRTSLSDHGQGGCNPAGTVGVHTHSPCPAGTGVGTAIVPAAFVCFVPALLLRVDPAQTPSLMGPRAHRSATKRMEAQRGYSLPCMVELHVEHEHGGSAA